MQSMGLPISEVARFCISCDRKGIVFAAATATTRSHTMSWYSAIPRMVFVALVLAGAGKCCLFSWFGLLMSEVAIDKRTILTNSDTKNVSGGAAASSIIGSHPNSWPRRLLSLVFHIFFECFIIAPFAEVAEVASDS